jgi:hypothetical protein
MSNTPSPALRPLLAIAVLLFAGIVLADPPKSIFDDPAPPRPGTKTPPPAKPSQPPSDPVKPAPVKPAPATDDDAAGSSTFICADDFVCDIYLNGKLVPADRRKFKAEIFGAQAERIFVDLKAGDWIVFNVVNNRLRWGGAYYFAAAGQDAKRNVTFVSDPTSADWSACDDLASISRFVAERDFAKDRRAQPPKNPWPSGDKEMSNALELWSGNAVWGDPDSRSTWIKFIVPAGFQQ